MTTAMDLKDTCSWKENLMVTRGKEEGRDKQGDWD